VGRYLIVGCVLLVLGTSGVLAGAASTVSGEDSRILPGVSIDGLDVGGLTAAEASVRVQASVRARLQRVLVVRIAEVSVPFTYSELGLRAGPVDDAIGAASALGHSGPLWSRWSTWLLLAHKPINIRIPYSRDEGTLHTALRGLTEGLPPRPRDAAVTVRGGTVVLEHPSEIGYVLDLAVTRDRLIAALDASASEVEAAVTTLAPTFTTEDANALQGPLASFTTQVAPIPNRTHNISLAAEALHGRLLAPGEIFSYNQAIGPTTSERGFREAPVLLNDELVPGEGGGVCQVSSTLFNVVLLADLEILTRASHSRPVAYIPLGRDATVNSGTLDFRFRNTTGQFLLLWTTLQGQSLTITAYGTPVAGREVSLVVTDREEIAPPEGTLTKLDPELEAGQVVTRKAQVGYRVKLYRLVKVDGQLVRTEYIGASYYRPLPYTVKVGTKKSLRV